MPWISIMFDGYSQTGIFCREFLVLQPIVIVVFGAEITRLNSLCRPIWGRWQMAFLTK